jgi:hypothetical protein
MRDTLLHIFRTLGPLAGWTNHNYDVAQEPTQLLPLYPGHRPADVGIILQSQALPSHQPPHTYPVLIDVTITPTPKFPCHDAPLNPYNPYAAQAQKTHWNSKCTQFQGRRHGTTANLNLTLIPFMIDPFGSFGCFATCLLYGTPTIHGAPPAMILLISHRRQQTEPLPLPLLPLVLFSPKRTLNMMLLPTWTYTHHSHPL